jgi:DNA-binding LacI/PurR family transcriptional regulator
MEPNIPSLPLTQLKSEMARNKIAELIHSGQLAAGQKLPSEGHLSRSLNVTRQTVRRGLAELVADGLIEKRPRIGNFVKSARSNGRIGIALHSTYASQGKYQHPASMAMDGAGLLFNERGYLCCNLAYRHGQLWKDVGEVAIANGIKGILLNSGFDTSVEDLEKFLKADIKLVLFGYHPAADELGIPQVWLDSGMALCQIVKRLISLGHRRIILVRPESSPSREVEDSLLQHVCRRTGLGSVADIAFSLPNQNNILDLDAISKIFEQDRLPTAIIASDDVIANEVFRQCYARNLRVPDDVSLAARWDSMPTTHPVPLTAPDCLTLSRRGVEICVQMLLKLLNDEPLLECSVSIRCDVQWKSSIGPVSAK